jgi:predicted small lipoprotein YifL
MIRTLALLLAIGLLAGACGKVGPIRPPGPADQVTYPRVYPAR